MKTFCLSLTVLAVLAVASCAEEARPTQATVPAPASLTTPTLASFTAGTWTLSVDRAWDGQSGAPQVPSDTIDESAYKAVSGGGPAYQVVVSNGGQQVTISAAGVSTVQARRSKATEVSAQYDVSRGAFAGGRFVVWTSGLGLQGELTIYGSGVPIVKSERGAVTSLR